MLLQLRLHRVEVGARARARNADEIHAMQLQQAVEIVVARVLDEDRVAGLEQVAHQQVHRLARAERDQDLRRLRLDAELLDASLQQFAQCRVAERRRVIDHAGAVGARHVADRLREAVHVAPCLGNEAAAELQRFARMIELLQDVGRFVFGAARVGRTLATHCGAVPFGHVKAGTRPRIQITERDEPVVGLDHGETADVVVGGELADRRQFRAGMRGARAYPVLYAADDLLGERHAVFAVQFNVEFHGLPFLALLFAPLSRASPAVRHGLSWSKRRQLSGFLAVQFF